MLKLKCDSEAQSKRATELISEIETRRGCKLYCLYHDTGIEAQDGINYLTVTEARTQLKQLGHVDKLSILVESPGGDPSASYALVRVLRRYTDDLEALVVNWAKSGATFVCMGANKILMADDGQIGPLDVQLPDPRGGKSVSALNAFKSLEFLREHVLQALELVVRYYVETYEMDLPHAIEYAQPLVSDMVRPLFDQVDPLELGEARRHLAVGEEYSKRIMERYSYKNYSEDQIAETVRSLVWGYPSHGFFIGRNEAANIGLNVERLDDETTELCEELITTVKRCTGLILPRVAEATPSIAEEEQGGVLHETEGAKKHEVQATTSPDGRAARAG
jgi:hypothetical protein